MARIIGIFLVVAGALGLLYGGFTYTKGTHTANLGPIVLQVKEKETLYVPIMVSAAVFGFGALLLLVFRRK